VGIIQRQGIRNSIITYVGLFVGAISLLFVQPHFLTKEEIGLTRILFSFSSLMANFTTLGMNSITYKFFPYFRDKEKGHHGYFGLMLVLPFLGFVIFGIILFVLKGFIIAKYIDQSKLFTEYFYYIFPLTFFLSFINVLIAYSYSIFRTSVPAFINDVLVRIGSIILFTIYFVKWLTLSQFIFLFVGIYGLQFILLIVYLFREDRPTITINRGYLKEKNVSEMFKYGLLMSIASLSSIGLKYVDSVMLGMYKPKEVGLNALDIIGIYSIAAFIATIVEAPLNALEKIAVPQIAESWAKNDIQNIEDIYHKSSKYLFLIGGLLFVLVNLNLASLFALMPDKNFALGGSVVFIISLGTLINMSTGNNDAILSTSPKYTYMTYSLISIFVIAILNYLLFIPLFGMIGAAIATAFSAFLFNLAKYVFIWIFFRIQPFTINTLKISGIILITYFICGLIPLTIHPVFEIGIRSIAIVSVFITLTIALNVVPELVLQWKKKLG
jgi:O-antigen/teichoic acid export membrane protein